MAPIGIAAFHLYLTFQTGEWGVWFRVQSEAWEEGTSFGRTAVSNTLDFFRNPFTSPTDAITALSFLCMLGGLWCLWKRPLPSPLVAYTAVILALMLIPATVTARPRFLYTAFPLLIAVAAWWPRRDRYGWELTLLACGGGSLRSRVSMPSMGRSRDVAASSSAALPPRLVCLVAGASSARDRGNEHPCSGVLVKLRMRVPALRFADALVAHDLPRLSADRRAAAVAFAQSRLAVLPSPMSFGVGAVGAVVAIVGAVVGHARLAEFLARRPVPVVRDYVRLLRSLSIAYVWETWPDSRADGSAP
ncbi:MAG: hypothetical protein WKF58_14130 [Ilumatobacteraceae bacterium]